MKRRDRVGSAKPEPRTRGTGRWAIALLALSVAPLTAVTPGARASRAADPAALVAADSLYWAGDARESLRVLDAHLRAQPDDYEARWKAARAAVSSAKISLK